MDRLFGLDMQLIMDALQFGASVFVLFLLASYLLFNPVRKMLKERQDGIKKNIDDANADKESAAELKEQYEAKLKGIEKEAEQILSEARQKALKRSERGSRPHYPTGKRRGRTGEETRNRRSKTGNDCRCFHDGRKGSCSFY